MSGLSNGKWSDGKFAGPFRRKIAFVFCYKWSPLLILRLKPQFSIKTHIHKVLFCSHSTFLSNTVPLWWIFKKLIDRASLPVQRAFFWAVTGSALRQKEQEWYTQCWSSWPEMEKMPLYMSLNSTQISVSKNWTVFTEKQRWIKEKQWNNENIQLFHPFSISWSEAFKPPLNISSLTQAEELPMRYLSVLHRRRTDGNKGNVNNLKTCQSVMWSYST